MDAKLEIDNVIKLGRSWGMSDGEIKACLLAEMEEAKKEQNGYPMLRLLSSLWFIIKIFVLFPAAILALLAVCGYMISVMSSISPELEMPIARLFAAYMYPIMSFVRTFKPLASALHIDVYYYADCLVENPYYLEEIDSCEPCEFASAFSYLEPGKVSQQKTHIEELKPFVVKNLMNPVNLTELKQMYETQAKRIEMGETLKFYSNLPSTSGFADVLLKMDANSITAANRGQAHVYWESSGVPTAQAIRKLFPRPKFVSEEAEVSLTKRIMIDGPNAAEYELGVGGFANGWYFQAFGTRRVTLVPHPECTKECAALTVVAQPGDIVYFQDQFWRLVSSPDEKAQMNELSISFTGSFTL